MLKAIFDFFKGLGAAGSILQFGVIILAFGIGAWFGYQYYGLPEIDSLNKKIAKMESDAQQAQIQWLNDIAADEKLLTDALEKAHEQAEKDRRAREHADAMLTATDRELQQLLANTCSSSEGLPQATAGKHRSPSAACKLLDLRTRELRDALSQGRTCARAADRVDDQLREVVQLHNAGASGQGVVLQ